MPRKHSRLKKIYCQGWGRNTAYLMPNPKLATEIRESGDWTSQIILVGFFKNTNKELKKK